MKLKITLALISLSFGVSAFAANTLDTNRIDQLTGLKGKYNEQEKVYKISSPRTDVKISVDGWQMPPFMGLTSWASFTSGKKAETMVMSDLVLFQDEVNPVMSAAFDAGLQVTALHNHFFFDDPKVYFMHIAGEGDADKLAKAVRAALDIVKEIRAANPYTSKNFWEITAPGKKFHYARAVAKTPGQQR